MTRIVLHPPPVPSGIHGGRVLLQPPWTWWATGPRPDADGHLFRYTWCDTTEYTVEFGPGSEVLIDPPSMHILEEYEDIYSLGDMSTPLRELRVSASVELVWHRQPGPRWRPLPYHTCVPGEYRQDRGGRADLRHPLDYDMFYQTMPILQWPITETADPVPVLTVDEIRRMEGLGPAPTSIDDYLQRIIQGNRDYEVQHRRRAVAVLISPEDYRRLLTMADPVNRPLVFYDPANPHATIFGLQVRQEPNLPPGRIIVVGPEGLPNFGDPLRGRVVRIAADHIPGLDASRIMSGTFSSGVITGRDIPFSPAVIPQSHLVNPEDRVLDEIDKLVNEQVRPGPVDDYHVNRYPKCKHCRHDWHGILCKLCDCLGELEDEDTAWQTRKH